MPSVVVPAHNEERVIGRLLSALLEPRDGPDAGRGASGLEVVVVPNGCSDATAEVAGGFSGVRVVETPVASKSAALQLGDSAATTFPRLYVDADVVLHARDAHELCRAVRAPGVLAAGPARSLPMDGVAWPVRWYYDVWQQLPGVRDELFGRGVIVVNEDGYARLTEQTSILSEGSVMADDLLIAMAFDIDERVVVPDALVQIRPPRTYADLVRRRVRAMTGNAQLALDGHSGLRPAPRTGIRTLVQVVMGERRPARKLALAPKVGLFMLTAVVARLRARRATRNRETTWLRDESSRT